MRKLLHRIWRKLLHFLWCYTPYRMRVLQVLYAPYAIYSQFLVLKKLRGYRIILPLAGLGDLVMISHSIREYKKSHPDEKFALVVGNDEKMHVQIGKLFPDAFDRIEQFYLDAYRHCYFPKVNKFRYAVKKFQYSKNAEQNFAKAIDMHMEYRYACFDGDVPSSEKIENLFAGDVRNFHAGKTVLLCPAANSCSAEDGAWWIKIAHAIKRIGLLPVFNTKDTVRYAGFIQIFPNLVDTINFVSKGGFAICTRSGMCDILAYFTKAKLIVLWPDGNVEWNVTTRTPWVSQDGHFDYSALMHAWSVQRIFPRAGICETVMSADVDVSQIISLLGTV